MLPSPNHTRSRTSRRAAVLAAVLVALLVAMLICGSLLQVAAARRRLAREQQRRAQASWLAEAGLERGAAAFAADPAYRGETWEIAPRDLNASGGGLVEITIEEVPEHAERGLLRVRAEFPAGHDQKATKSRQVPITLSLPYLLPQ